MMVSTPTFFVLIVACIMLSNDIRIFGVNVIAAVEHTKQAAIRTLEAKESIQNMFYDSSQFMNHAGSAIQNTSQAVGEVVKVVKHSKEAISRAQTILKNIQIWMKATDIISDYTMECIGSSKKRKRMT